MNISPDQNPQPPVKKMRWLGLIMFIGGGVLGYLAIVVPLLAAAHHEEDVSISLEGVMLAPALMVIGLVLFFMGNNRSGEVFGSRQNPSGLGAVLCLVTAGIGILLYVWLKSRLRAYGYGI
jgi:hypothetical protein